MYINKYLIKRTFLVLREESSAQALETYLHMYVTYMYVQCKFHRVGSGLSHRVHSSHGSYRSCCSHFTRGTSVRAPLIIL